ncbi:hypothetical protein QZH41_019507 [Actinostola sp. cb2023]|nr:hypothetical protein QZH41_019507 [Actinostola sp. cb2023]
MSSRTNNAQITDDLKIDLGNVTVAGSCKMKFVFEFQLLDHPNFVHGQSLWAGVAVQYLNDTVFAAQEAVKTMTIGAPQPVLIPSFEPTDSVFDSSKPMVIKVKVVHDCSRTSAHVATSKLTIGPPTALKYSKMTLNSGSITVTKTAGGGSDLIFQAGAMNYTQSMDFDVEFTLDSSSVKKGRDLEFVTFYYDVTAQGSSSCASAVQDYSQTSSFTGSTKMYKPCGATKPAPLQAVPFSTCDTGPGSGSTDIAYQAFNCSSYAAGAGPDEARFASSGAWKPSNSLKKDRRQFLQVKFTTMVKLRRFAIQGKCDEEGDDIDRFVKALKVYHSNNGALWKSVKVGSKVKIFEANTNCKGVAIVPLPYDIETKYIRINPVDFENAIAMKVEFYGCKSTAPETTVPIPIPNRSIIAHLNNIIVCNTGMDRKVGESSCHFSSDGMSWKGTK